MHNINRMSLGYRSKAYSNMYRKAFFWGVLINASFGFYNIFRMPAFCLVGLWFMGVTFFLCEDRELMLISAQLLPNIMMIKFIGNMSAIASYYVLLINLKHLVFQGRQRISLFAILHFFSVLITSMIYVDAGVAFSAVKTIVFLQYLYSFFQEEQAQESEYKQAIVLFYILGILINIIFGMLYYSHFGRSIFSHLFAGIRNDRNYFSSMLAFGITVSIVMIKIKRKQTAFCLCCIFFFLLIGLIAQSRMFFLALVFPLIALVSFIEKSRTRKILFLMVIVAVVGTVLFEETVLSTITSLLNRFKEDDVYTGSGRTNSWEFFINLTVSNPVRIMLGNGFGSRYLEETRFVEHNTFIQAFSTVGVLGTVTLLCLYISIYSKLLRSERRKKLYAYMPLLVILFCNMSINSLYALQFDFSIFIGLMLVDLSETENGQTLKVREGVYTA